MPAGTSSSSGTSSIVRPSPPQRSQGVSTIVPAPSQRGHVPERTICPRIVRETCWTRPTPAHAGHVIGEVPGAAPVPPQGSQVRAAWTWTSSVVPVTTSARSISTCATRSGPRAGPRRGLARRAEEGLAEERREDVRQAAEVGHRGEPAAAHARVPEAVVELPPLGIGEHLVRLRHRTEPRARVRVVAHVGMELARETAERALDLRVARVPGDAEQLVVVLLRRRHQWPP